MTVFTFNIPTVLAAVATPTAIKMTPAPLPAVNFQNVPNLTKTPLALNYPWVTHSLAAIFVLLAISLIVMLAFQTTKQEGLSGTIGGRVESAYRPRLGFDQQLARMTSWVAIAFVFVGFLLSLSGI